MRDDADLPALLLATFDQGVSPEHRVAGVSAAGRIAAAARMAGIESIWIVTAQGQPPSDTVLDDLRRIGAEGVRFVSQSVADAEAPGHRAVIRLSGRYLPRVQTLAGLRDTANAIDLADTRAATREIVRATAKASDGVVSRRFNRPISQAMTRLIIGSPRVRPWHLTLVTALTGLVMFVFLAFGGAQGLVVGGLLFHAASVVDGVDGELARATFRTSNLGALLDTRVDLAITLGFILGVAISLTRLYGVQQAIVGGAALLLGVGGIIVLTLLLRRRGERNTFNGLKTFYRARFPTGAPRRIVDAIVATTSRDYFAFGFAIIILAGGGYTLCWILLGFITLWAIAVLGAVPSLLRVRDTSS